MTTFNVSFQMFNLIERLASKGWRGILEGSRRLMGLYTKVLLVVFGRQTTGHCLAVYSMSREILRIYRACGPKFLALYLKQVNILVMKYVGGEKFEHRLLTPKISLTRTGIPRFIPPEYRKGIRRRDPQIIRVVLSVCALARMLKIPPKRRGRLDTTTIASEGFEISDVCQQYYEHMCQQSGRLIYRYIPAITTIPLELGLVFNPSFSSTPNSNLNPFRDSVLPLREYFNDVNKGVIPKYRLNMYHTLPLDAGVLLLKEHFPNICECIDYWSIFFYQRVFLIETTPRSELTRSVEERDALRSYLNAISEPFHKFWWMHLRSSVLVGRIGLKVEGSGKVRPFAICNPVLQSLLKPLHDWTMRILRTLDMDGTYNQTAPLERLSGLKNLFSFDLKAATDLLPVDLTYAIIKSLFSEDLADGWSSIMSYTPFSTPDKFKTHNKWREVRFERGQPLGYYSSWPLFTLTHHCIVWMAANKVYPNRVFKRYAILGDDIVIADYRVAEEYKIIMRDVQGVLSLEKSLVSFNGSCEFAKRFIINNHLKTARADCSPVSLACLRLCRGFVSPVVFKMFKVNARISVRLRGGGYRVASRFREDYINFNKLSKRWKRHLLTLYAPSGIFPLPFIVWLSFPEMDLVDCYTLGVIRYRILKAVRPPDLNEKSFNLLDIFWSGDDANMKEEVLYPLLLKHLHYLKWYAEVMFDYSVSFEDLLDPPVSPYKIEREADESIFQRYGLIFKMWDIVRSYRNNPNGILPPPLSYEFDGRILLPPLSEYDSVYTLSKCKDDQI